MLLPACAGARRWGATPDTTAVYARFADNLEDVDPAFVDEANLDLTLSPASPALVIRGFVPIPFRDIGLEP